VENKARGKRFTEKGFGSNSFGASHVVAGLDGSALHLKSVEFPDGKMGGEVFLFSRGTLQNNSKSFCIENGLAQIVVRRNGNIASVKLIEWSDREPTFEGECGLLLYAGKKVGELMTIKLSYDSSMSNGMETTERLTNIYMKALEASINRSFSSNPQGIFWGKMARDGKPYQRLVPAHLVKE